MQWSGNPLFMESYYRDYFIWSGIHSRGFSGLTHSIYWEWIPLFWEGIPLFWAWISTPNSGVARIFQWRGGGGGALRGLGFS